MRNLRLAGAFLIAGLSVALLPAQQGTAAVSGIVIDGDSDSPVSGALVQIAAGAGRTGTSGRELTDAKGRFVFVDLAAADQVKIVASKLGYLDGGYGIGPGASGGLVTLGAGEWVKDVRVRLRRPASISGTVIDERGDPAISVYVRVLAKIRILGRDQFAGGPVTLTDEHGRYRITGLAPGQYVVQVPSASRRPDDRGNHLPVPPVSAEGRPMTYPTTYAPAVTTLDTAASVDLQFGDQHNGSDVVLDPVPLFRVTGIVVGPRDALTGLTLRLLPKGAEDLGIGSDLATAGVAGNGAFAFLNVPTGMYSIDASRATGAFTLPIDFFNEASRLVRAGGSSQEVGVGPAGLQFFMTRESVPAAYWAREPVVVGDSDLTGLTVNLRATGTMRGHTTKELAPNAPEPSLEPGIQLDPADGSPFLGAPRTQMDPRLKAPGGNFMVQGLLPGKYFLRAQYGWIVKSISWSGRDYTDQPFDAAETPNLQDVEVLVTNNGASLAGFVRDDSGAPAANVVVMVFPAASAHWADFGLWPPRIRSVVASQAGRYIIGDMPAGEYKVIALAGSGAMVTPTREFFTAVERTAAEASLAWGQSTPLNLVVQRVAR